nr:hypothetical protein [Tanacetum cinerariifolium]
MKESKAYKTYLGYASGTIPPKVARKFKKASPSKKDSMPIPADEELEPPLETKSKRKEKVDVARGKRIDLLSEVTLTKEDQMKEVRKKSLRDFHKSHPSGSGSGNDEDDSNNEEASEQENDTEEHESDSEQDTDRNESDFESDQQDDDEDDDDDDNDDDKSEGDEDRGMDSDDVQDKKADLFSSSDLASKFLIFLDIPPTETEIVSPLDVHVHHEVPRIHTSILLVVLVSVIPEASPVYTNIPQSSQTFTSSPLQSTPSPLPITKTTNIPSLILDLASVFILNDRVIASKKGVAELKNDPLHTQVTALVDDHLDTRMGATREEFMNFLLASLTDRITEQVRNLLPQILLEEVSNFAPPVIKKMIQESLNQVNLAKAFRTPGCYDGLIKSYNLDKDFFSSYDMYSLKHSRDDKDKDEGPFAGSDRGLKKRKTRKDTEPTTSLKNKDSSSRSSKGTKSQPKYVGKPVHVEELKFEVGDTDTPQVKSLKEFDELISALIDFSSYILNGLKIKNLTQEILLGPPLRLLKGTCSNYAEFEYDFEECYKALSEKLDWENPEGSDYPFDLSKPFHLITRRNHQRVPVEFFINNDLKYLQGGTSTMTYTTSTTKTKAAQYDLPVIKDMRKTFYAYARGIQSRGDVYSTKHILAVTHISVMRKHGYGYLEEIMVRRADNKLYKFKEGDDIADFAIALKMFTKNLVIQKRVKDL